MAVKVALYFFYVASLAALGAASCPNSGVKHPVKALVPAYWGPDSTNGCSSSGLTGYWKSLAACGANCTAIINPNSGPGVDDTQAATFGAQYTPCIRQLAAAGVQTLGYIATTQTSKSLLDVTTEFKRYNTSFVGLGGIFFDEGPSWYAAGPGGANNDKSYYAQAASLVRSGITVLNPGGRFEPSMTDIFNIVVGFEESASNWKADANYHGMCPIPKFTTAHTDDIFCTGAYPGRKPYVPNSYQNDTNTCATCGAKIAALVYQATATTYPTIINQCADAGYGYCYVTNDGLDNPWDTLPNFLSCYTS